MGRGCGIALAEEALYGRLRALRHIGDAAGLLRASMTAAGGLRPLRAVACSLNQRTGDRRKLIVVRADREAVSRTAHRYDATVNDAVLVCVAGALHALLHARGEDVDPLILAVPVASRHSANVTQLGNQVAPLLVEVPATGDLGGRLRLVAATVRTHKAAATGPPPIALLGPVFRVLAALGGYRWYMNHQRRLHTVVSHVRGPAAPVTIAGAPVHGIIPIAVAEAGNVTLAFQVLSYAGTLTITATVDPDHVPDLPSLVGSLRDQLDLLTHAE